MVWIVEIPEKRIIRRVTDREKKYVEVIMNEVDRLEKILNQILIFPQEPHFDLQATI